jgi:hypothetical protein
MFCFTEFDSRNFACLISSLSQILMDPNFRTQVGFQSLVQREWVMMGHPFQKYNNLIQQGNNERVIKLSISFFTINIRVYRENFSMYQDNLIIITSLTCFPLPICHCVGDLKKLYYG